MASFGFGNNNNNAGGFGGFGGGSTGGGFGANNTSTGGSLFGQTNTTAGNNTGFGASGNTGFGASTAGGSLFGGGTSTAGGGGFGGFGQNNNNTANTASAFGGGGGGLFSGNQNKTTGFGATNTAGSLFGGTNNTTAGFGATNNATSNPFAPSTNNASTFGANNTNAGGGFGGFGATNTAAATNNNNGTAAAPFQVITEKDGASTGLNAYQSLVFHDPYKLKSFEELRVEDYLQGRRYGNTNGQAGSFGQSTGFGGFGATNNTSTGGAGMFGAANNTTTSTAGGFGGFGATANNNTPATAGFGTNNNNNNTAGGLFGQNKPGGLFGATSGASTNAFGATTGGTSNLFGGNNANTNTGFGATNNTGTTGGGLFGAANNNTNNQTNAFGASNNSGGGLFGANNNQNKPAGGLFGATNNNTTGGGLFGQQNQNQQSSNLFGQNNNNTANTGTSLFGGANNNTNQAKPAFGGFGATNNNTGFGNNTNTGGSLFGNTNNNATANTGGLFSNTQNQAKPGGLFGNTTTNTNTGGGLFGNTNNQTTGGGLFGAKPAQTAGNSLNLFGGNNNNQQAKPAGGLFGGSTNTGGNSLFGNNNTNTNNNTGGGLFGGLNNSTSNTGSLFAPNNSQQQGQQNQLHASLTVSPYGNDQLFASLGAPSPPIGPLATPLQGAKPTPKKNQSLLGSLRVNSPVYTPRASTLGRTGGYGLSYSNYGTPNSAFSGSLTPGASSLLRPTGSIGSALTSRLNKSFSTSNLRGDGTPETGSLLRSAPLTPGSMNARYGSGSMRKLRIDRTLRENLFEPAPKEPETDSRRVNFDETAERPREAADVRPTSQNALITEEQAQQEQAQEDRSAGLYKKDPRQNGAQRPEMEQVSTSTALTTVPEDSATRPGGSAPRARPTQGSDEPGEYYAKPPLEQLKKMSRSQLEKVGYLVVGRNGIGYVKFKNCDLTSVPLDDIFGKIVVLTPRNATVYPTNRDKPPVGSGLNVPSTIVLLRSWPKASHGKPIILDTNSKQYKAHIKRLKEVGDTRFVSYDQPDGAWTFEVDHFTTYALDDEDDEDEQMADDTVESSGLSDIPATLDGNEETMQSIEMMPEDLDDTFQFKLQKRAQLELPGTFDTDIVSIVEDDEQGSEDLTMSGGLPSGMEDPFRVSGGPVQAPSPDTFVRLQSGHDRLARAAKMSDEEDAASQDATEVPGAFVPESKPPRSILKPTAGFRSGMSPVKLVTASWEDQLQQTMSPSKRDRRALRDMQQVLLAQVSDDDIDSPFKQSMFNRSALNESYLATKSAKKSGLRVEDLNKSKAFTTSMDIMNSLWADDNVGKKAGAAAKGFENPQPKKPRLSATDGLSEQDHAFHDNMKPSFNPALGVLTYSTPGSAPPVSGELASALQPVVGEHKDVRFVKFAPALDMHARTLLAQKQLTHIAEPSKKVKLPAASIGDLPFATIGDALQVDENSSKLAKQESAIWRLSSVIFDPIEVGCSAFVNGLTQQQISLHEQRIKIEAFGAFWSQLVSKSVQEKLSRASTAEERALLYLTQNNTAAACDALVAAKDYRLATMVAQLPGSVETRETMLRQIEVWRKRKDWSEMSESVRALYSILAGQVCTVPGQDGASEDHADHFCLSEKFDLTWQQSYALRLFFGGAESLFDATRAYCKDVDSERESVYPTTLWDSGYEGELFVDKEDTLMGLLRLSIDPKDTNISDILDPLTVSGSSLNSRLAWQLANVLETNQVCNVPADKLDQLTVDFAAELEAARDINGAAWVLLHIENATLRYNAVNSLLQRNGARISSPDDDTDARTLVTDLHIPASLVWAAKATSAAHDDEFHHIAWLMMAHTHDSSAGYDGEAHEALCTVFAPHAIIEEDYERLAQLLSHFNSENKLEGWDYGGEIYASYLQLLNLRLQDRSSRQAEQLVDAMRRGVAANLEEGGVNKTLEQRVAMLVMSRFADDVAKEFATQEDEDAVMAGVDMVESSQQGQTDLLNVYRKAMGTAV